MAFELLAIDTFECFYQSQFGLMVGLAYQLTGRRDVAEDLVQEAMVRAVPAEHSRIAATSSTGRSQP